MTEERTDSWKSRLRDANSVAVILRENPVLDDVMAGLSLYEWLEKEGYYAFLLCPQSVNLPEGIDGGEKILLKPRGQELVISWPNNQDDIEEVRTQINDEINAFELVVKTRNGSAPVAIHDLSFGYQNTEVDVIILVGDAWKSLECYEELDQAVQAHTVDLGYIGLREAEDRTPDWSLGERALASNCAQVTKLGATMRWRLDKQIASRLLIGMEHRTQRFSKPDLPAEFFELVATCLRAGGTRARLETMQLKDMPAHDVAADRAALARQKTTPEAKQEKVAGPEPSTPRKSDVVEDKEAVETPRVNALKVQAAKASKPPQKHRVAGQPEWLRPKKN